MTFWRILAEIRVIPLSAVSGSFSTFQEFGAKINSLEVNSDNAQILEMSRNHTTGHSLAIYVCVCVQVSESVN